MWSDLGLFATPPQSVLDIYTKTAQGLSDLRKTKLANALQQIKLQYAPQREKADTDLAVANAAIKKSDAQYEPSMNAADLMMKHLNAQSKNLENAMNSVKFKYLPQQQQAEIALKNAQVKEALAHAEQYLGKAAGGGKGAPAYLDPETGQVIPGLTTDKALGNSSAPSPAAAQTQVPSDDASEENTPAASSGAPTATPPAQTPTPQSVAATTVAAAAQPEQTFPGANPKAMNVLAPVGVTDSRGHPVAYRNLRTGERLAVLTPASRTKMISQIGSLDQAIPYMDDLIKYGTIAKLQPAGASQLLPGSWGGISRDDALKYNATLKQNVEHVINGSNLKQTETTLPMVHAILERGNLESRDGYKDRMLKFKSHLIDLENNRKNALALGAVSLDKYTQDAEQKFIESEYKKVKAMEKNGFKTSRPGMVYVKDAKGNKGYISEKQWNSATEKEKSAYKRVD